MLFPWSTLTDRRRAGECQTPADRTPSRRRHVRRDPARQPVLVDLAGGKVADHDRGFRLARGELDVVQAEKRDDREQGCPLVAVHEWMIASDPEPISCGKTRKISALIGPPVFRPPKRRLESTGVSDARGSPELT